MKAMPNYCTDLQRLAAMRATRVAHGRLQNLPTGILNADIAFTVHATAEWRAVAVPVVCLHVCPYRPHLQYVHMQFILTLHLHPAHTRSPRLCCSPTLATALRQQYQ